MNTKLLNVQTSKSLWLTILQRPLLLLKENLISVICESDISRMCTCVCIHECLYARVCVCMFVSLSHTHTPLSFSLSLSHTHTHTHTHTHLLVIRSFEGF